jgi:hypothetical protein
LALPEVESHISEDDNQIFQYHAKMHSLRENISFPVACIRIRSRALQEIGDSIRLHPEYAYPFPPWG